jgi:hypothetical protein
MSMPRPDDDLSRDRLRPLQTGKLQIDRFINFHPVYITGSCSFYCHTFTLPTAPAKSSSKSGSYMFIVMSLFYQLQQLDPLHNLCDLPHG